jgi:endonuclease/exonuclease/phosphatase family metal-dependent hydrolase
LITATLGLFAIVIGPITFAFADNGTTVRVMTRNLHQGTSFEEALAATTPAQFVAAVTTIYNNIVATKPMERAKAVAREIARERPDLVGLQEATILRNGTAPASNVVSDQLQALLSELRRLGHHYETVAIMPGIDPEAPTTLGFDARVTYRTAIIARKAWSGSDLRLTNMQVQYFLVNRVFPTAVGIPFINTRGWASIDATVRGRSFRFVTTHLESSPPFATQLAQAGEMIQNAGNTTLPVIFVGDFNAAANASADPTFPTYQRFIDAGFTDAWKQKHPSLPGFTCCQAPNVLNTTSLLSQRIDLILYRGDISVEGIKLVGEKLSDRTPSLLWPSDHAGVVATLKIRH